MNSDLAFSFFRRFGKKRPIFWIFNKIIFFYLLFIVVLNLPKFKKANGVFVNSFAFGHSVQESIVFFSEYGLNGVCISVGNKSNRNKYLKYIFKPHKIIHFWLPNLTNINLYHALRKRVHEVIDSSLQKSKIINIVVRKNFNIIDRETLCNQAAIRNLTNDYSCSEEGAVELLKKFDHDFQNSFGNQAFSSLSYLGQQKNPIQYSTPPEISHLNDKFMKTAQLLNADSLSKELKICTLILRTSWKAWSGTGFASFRQSIDYLKSKNYLINVIGDTQEFQKLLKHQSIEGVYYYKQYRLNSKIFQILSIMNSNFCFGDPSGAYELVYLFNKKTLLLNTLPFGLLRYNTVTLPRIWVDEKGDQVSLDSHSGTFLSILLVQNPFTLIRSFCFSKPF